MQELKSALPLVTIGIPTHNRPKGLRYVLQCATSQTYKNLEILVVDNCTEPKEAVAEIIDTYRHNTRVRYIRHERNMGPLFNFEYIFTHAKGKYLILFPDDDHYDDPRLIEYYVSSMQSSSQAAAAMAAVEYIDCSGNYFIRDEPPYNLNGKIFSRFWNYLTTSITDNLVYAMLRTELVRGYKFEKNVNYPEKFLIQHLLANGPILDCPGAGYKNIYSFKSEEEKREFFGQPLLRNHHFLWIRKAFFSLPLTMASAISILYLGMKMPKLSWPFRKIFGFPKDHPGRKKLRPPLSKKHHE